MEVICCIFGIQWIFHFFLLFPRHIVTELRSSCHCKSVVSLLALGRNWLFSLDLSLVQSIDMETILVVIFWNFSCFVGTPMSSLVYLAFVIVFHIIVVYFGSNFPTFWLIFLYPDRSIADGFVIVYLGVLSWNFLDGAR